MSSLNWAPLLERRARAKLIILLKAKSGIIELPLDYLKCRNSSTRSHKHNYFIPPPFLVDSHLYSFFPETIRLWNNDILVERKISILKLKGNYFKKTRGITQHLIYIIFINFYLNYLAFGAHFLSFLINNGIMASISPSKLFF